MVHHNHWGQSKLLSFQEERTYIRPRSDPRLSAGRRVDLEELVVPSRGKEGVEGMVGISMSGCRLGVNAISVVLTLSARAGGYGALECGIKKSDGVIPVGVIVDAAVL